MISDTTKIAAALRAVGVRRDPERAARLALSLWATMADQESRRQARARGELRRALRVQA